MALIEEGQKVLILRYGKKKDCIDKHIEVIKEKWLLLVWKNWCYSFR